MKCILQPTFLMICCMASVTDASEIVLFDGSLGTLPSTQDWPFLADPIFGHSVTQTAGPASTEFNSLSPLSDRGGYFTDDPVLGLFSNPHMPVIERVPGFTVRVDVRVLAEDHVTGPAGDDNGDGVDDRSGFSLIAISQDLAGLELAFWEDRVWVQEDDAVNANDLFTQAESVAFDTTSAVTRFELVVRGTAYELYANEAGLPILDGALRNYANFSGSIDPYEIPSFLFLGDDTTRGESRVELGYVSITQHDAVLGDLDCDGDVDFDDIDAFVLGLTDPAGYEVVYGLPSSLKGDLDDDGDHDFDDIAGFVAELTGSPSTRVPEPGALLLFLLGGALLARARQTKPKGRGEV